MFGAARQRLGASAAAALLAEGRAMSRYDASRYGTRAGTVAPPPAAAGAAGPRPAPAATAATAVLTAREHEIAALIGRGLSNRAIADELVISPATVARHVANIFTKLGFTSRAQVAAWLADAGAGQGS
jgi:DNA-binding NarL/FixJ family response regulator